ncbi:MAG: SGNH/GDSL hydrolase family protein [Proteobacteria bacterium]|nr:SGNH/GDSL hydrolase family protein [Pseudomonadota bacterium]
MTLFDLAGRATTSLAAAVVLLAIPAVALADTGRVQPPCNTPRDLLRLGGTLTHVAQKLERHEPITIVAIGSSSTAGAGASSAAANYPNRLAVELRQQFPAQPFNVINQGVNGEEVPDMLRRFDTAVIAQKPDLVLWQLGTNSLIRDHQVKDRGASIRTGLNRIRAAGADVILIDPQYAPKVIAKPLAPQMVDFIAELSKQEDVGLFRRFEAMKRWNHEDGLPFSAFTIADGLHMNDWGYACMAHNLGIAIAEAVKSPVVAARAAAR